jgi:hypothetical protein
MVVMQSVVDCVEGPITANASKDADAKLRVYRP